MGIGETREWERQTHTQTHRETDRQREGGCPGYLHFFLSKPGVTPQHQEDGVRTRRDCEQWLCDLLVNLMVFSICVRETWRIHHLQWRWKSYVSSESNAKYIIKQTKPKSNNQNCDYTNSPTNEQTNKKSNEPYKCLQSQGQCQGHRGEHGHICHASVCRHA